jgi:hypothetical protein
VVFANFSDLYSPRVFLCFVSFVGTKEMKINACQPLAGKSSYYSLKVKEQNDFEIFSGDA